MRTPGSEALTEGSPPPAELLTLAHDELTPEQEACVRELQKQLGVFQQRLEDEARLDSMKA